MKIDLALAKVSNGVTTKDVKEAPPEVVKALLVEKTANDAVQTLLKLTKDISEEVLEGESKYSEIFTKHKYMKVTNWASGGGLSDFQGFRRFEDGTIQTFFEKLFSQVAGEIFATLSRNNLFHGHMVFDGEESDIHKDFRIVFHAYEHPKDKYATLQKYLEAKELESEVPEFSSKDENFYKRNVIWSLKNNKLYIPDYTAYINNRKSKKPNQTYISFLEPTACSQGIATVEQKKLGTELVCINYFPNENVGPFLQQK